MFRKKIVVHVNNQSVFFFIVQKRSIFLVLLQIKVHSTRTPKKLGKLKEIAPSQV